MVDKKSLRKTYLKKRNAYVFKNEDSLIIRSKLREVLKPYNKIALYYPIKGEVDIWPLVLELSTSKEVYLPVTLDKLYFKRFMASGEIVLGKMGIMEPTGQMVSDINKIEAIVIPAIAINTKKYRLGYGKGLYDRAIETYSGVKIGIIYSFQLTDIDFHEDHDMIFDLIITNER